MQELTVDEAATEDSTCLLNHASPSPAVRSWEYAKRPPGYLMSVCSPLVPDRVYEVTSSRPEATRRFKVLTNGSVQALGSMCD